MKTLSTLALLIEAVFYSAFIVLLGKFAFVLKTAVSSAMWVVALGVLLAGTVLLLLSFLRRLGRKGAATLVVVVQRTTLHLAGTLICVLVLLGVRMHGVVVAVGLAATATVPALLHRRTREP